MKKRADTVRAGAAGARKEGVSCAIMVMLVDFEPLISLVSSGSSLGSGFFVCSITSG